LYKTTMKSSLVFIL